MALFITMTVGGNRCCGCASRLSSSVSGCFLTVAASQLNPVRLVSFATAVTMATVLSSLRPFSYCMSVNRAAPMNLIQSPRVVTTQYGKLRGLIVYRPSSGDTVAAGFDATTGTKQVPVEQFLGLQYASTLGSELRFMPPTGSMEKWEGTRIALKHRPVCPQPVPDLVALARRLPRGRIEHFKRLAAFVDKQTEDCLSLNIYVPFYVVFIHGESYDVGTGNAYDGSVMAAYGQLVVVTLNYRLGVLGFLSTGDSNAPGNYAILDLVAALHWIKANILQFGGDPSSVTLMGHSHGAALVNLLLVSPVTRDSGLFRRAIILSGTALASWSVTSEPVRQAIQLTRAVNCTSSAEHQIPSSAGPRMLPSAVRRLSKGQSAVPLSHSHQTVDDAITLSPASLRCLKRLPVDRLVNAAGPTSLEAGPRYLAPFGPTIDGRSVLPAEVNRLTGDMARGTMFGGVDLLVGFMKNEGYVYLNQTDIDEGISSDRLHRAIRTFVRNVYTYHRQYINDILLYQYQQDLGNSLPTSGGPSHTADPASVRNLLMELIGDALQVAPSIDLARRHVATITGTSGSTNTRNHFSDLADDEDDDDWGDDVKQPLSQQTSTVGTTSTTTKSRPDVRLEQATSNESVGGGGPATYLYCFAYPTRFDVYPRWADGVHGDDLAYIFGAPLAAMGGLAVGVAMSATAPTVEPFPSVFTRADRLLSETVMRYWISFIRTGNPNSFIGPSSFKGDDSAGSLDSAIPYWPRFEMTNEHYLHFGVKPTVRQHFRADKMAFWLDLIPRLHRPDTNTAGSSSKFHQLDDPKNASSFESDGTLDVEYDDDIFSLKNSENDDVILTSTTPTSAPALPGTESVSVTSFPHKVDSSVQSFNLTTTLLVIGQSMSTVTDGNLAISDVASGIPIEPEVLQSDIDDITNGNEGTSLPTGKMALFGTGMIGCVVLIVNCAVFAAIFRRRSRMRKRDNTSAAQLVPRSDTDAAAATGSGRPSHSSTMNSTARRHHSATGSSQAGYRVHFAGDALSTSSSTVNGHGSSNGRVCSRLSTEEMVDDVRSPSAMNCTSFISDRHPVANGNGMSTMCNYSSFPPPPPPNFLASHASTTRRPLQDNDSLKDGSSIAPSTLPGTTSASIAALPPPSNTLRRTPYSPRYASDGRLKHFPVAGASSTKADSTVVKAVAAGGSTSNFGFVFGNTASLHYHPRCRHHHVLPNTCCDSPTISTKPMVQTDQ